MAYDVVFYEDHRGYSPVSDKLDELFQDSGKNKNARIQYEKWASYMKKLHEAGTRIGEPFVKHLEDGIWELRPLRDRILFYVDGNTIIYLHYFSKKTTKTPRKEINQAKKEREDWKNRP